VLFAGTPFELNRIMLIRLLVVAVLAIWLLVGTSRLRIIPTRAQVVLEFPFAFVRDQIVYNTLGEKDGKRFYPIIATIFFLVIAMNITGIVPGLNIAGTSVVGLPLLLAVIAWVLFVYAGLKKHPWGFVKNALFPNGVPNPALYIVITPIEFVSTFILRPVTLCVRLLMNMVAGHMLLVLCFSATQFFLQLILQQGNFIGLLGIGTFAFGFAFTLFEILVAALQAYVFALLTTVYIQLALADEH